jgi:hypothetical protein
MSVKGRFSEGWNPCGGKKESTRRWRGLKFITYKYEDSIMKTIKLFEKGGEERGGLREYNWGDNLVQSTLYKFMCYHNETSFYY